MDLRTSTLDDPSIGERAKQLADERLRAVTQCACIKPDDGKPVDSSKCPVHGPTTAPVAWHSGEHRPDDDWEALREMCGWCIPARVLP